MAISEPRGLQIWVDADACPVVIKEILFRAAERTQLMTTLVANKLMRVPPSPYIRALQVPGGFDVADDKIVVARIHEKSSDHSANFSGAKQ